MAINLDKSSALIVVDLQNDFCPGGALEVKGGDRVVHAMNHYITRFKQKGASIFATRDWHPAHHVSFKERKGPWPPHCVQGTKGADFHHDLKLPYGSEVISKAFLSDRDAYSGFQGTELRKTLKKMSVARVFIGGLATDYCVKHTVLDALKCGFETHLLTDAVRGVERYPGDSEKAIQEMAQAGARSIVLSDL